MEMIDLFPRNLAKVLRRTGDALSVPLAGLVTEMVHLACVFSPTTFVVGPGQSQIEPVVENFLNVGASGINKSGLSKNHEFLMGQVLKTLNVVSIDVDTLFSNGMFINRKDVPVHDSTATPAASIQKQCQNRSLARFDDEIITMLRSLMNGNGGTVEIGAQFRLTVFGSPPCLTNKLKSNIEQTRFPRFNSVANVQPAVLQKHFGAETTLFSIGLTSRFLPILLMPHFSESRRPPLSKDEQTMVVFAIAIAARGLTSFGCWTQEGVYEAKVTKDFGDDGDLVEMEHKELQLLVNRFESATFGQQPWLEVKAWEEANALNARNSAERVKAQQTNKIASGRFTLTHAAMPEPDDGLRPKLPDGFAAAGICDIRVFEAQPGSEQEHIFDKHVRQCDQRMKATDPISNNIDGKGAGHLLRMVGIVQIIAQAAEDVELILGSQPLNGVDEYVDFFWKVALVAKGEAEEKLSAAKGKPLRNFGTGTEM